ncbi:mevalonate kinase-like isoform X1 [Cucurbita pepo subsp. pepo]|uniref:mevalonate kinase-like isoform X1 n=1 Tax=Cucurbita pepo subsp. pepo TaxID=3664 RepID=UPI000C9D898D|nr:mevalonate kinase-like isoform X1 [Cucurbita pepo subsp. pepo]
MEVKARAPGKIILAGEHAVVHGSTAVAASVNLYTTASVRLPCSSDEDDIVKLQLKDLALEFAWPVSRIKEALGGFVGPISTPTSCPAECLKAIASLVEYQNIPEAKIKLASGVSAFLWLYSSILRFVPVDVAITSELPLGSGLGSSAAFCVAISAALLALSGSVNVDQEHCGWMVCKEDELVLLNKWAFEGEKIIHGKPSGIDNTVSTYGSMIKFKSGSLDLIKSNMPLKMLVTNTKVGRNTKALVAGVSERAIRHPDAMSSVFNAVDSISKELSILLQSAHDDMSLTEKEEQLAELMEMNQGLLQCMGVSHGSIETILRTTSKYELVSKLTGAGGGGCVLTLLPNCILFLSWNLMPLTLHMLLLLSFIGSWLIHIFPSYLTIAMIPL